ncbi:MAG: hypothetical protein ACPGO3_15675 [Magnetospiraceae bacterium]
MNDLPRTSNIHPSLIWFGELLTCFICLIGLPALIAILFEIYQASKELPL